MNRVQTMFTKSLLVAAAGLGLPACVAVAPEPESYYYSSPGYYYYQPGYYAAPRPAYSSYYFYYEDRDRDRRRDHRGHRHHRHH